MTNEESKRIIDENAAMAVACTYNVLFTNDIVSGLALDAVEAVRKSPLCCYKTKQAVNSSGLDKAIERYRSHEKRLYPLRISRTTVIYVTKNKCNRKYAEDYLNNRLKRL